MFKQRTHKIVFKYCARFSRCAWNWNYKDETFDKWLFRSSNSIKFMGDLQITTLLSILVVKSKILSQVRSLSADHVVESNFCRIIVFHFNVTVSHNASVGPSPGSLNSENDLYHIIFICLVKTDRHSSGNVQMMKLWKLQWLSVDGLGFSVLNCALQIWEPSFSNELHWWN